MSVLNSELGSYDSRGVVRFLGSFKVTTGSPQTATLIRDGKTSQFTVVRTSAGLWTVTIASGFPIPERMIYENAHISTAATLTAKAVVVHVVAGSYSQSARTFQIVCHVVGDVANSAYTDPVVGDANDDERIHFELVGSILSAGTDAG